MSPDRASANPDTALALKTAEIRPASRAAIEPHRIPAACNDIIHEEGKP